MKTLRSERLVIRLLSVADNDFILRLYNCDSFMQYIGDKSLRTLTDATRFIEEGPMQMYADHGVGLYRVELATDATALGVCGLLKRDTMEDVDLGFAFFPEFEGCGYALESAQAVLQDAGVRLGLKCVVAFTSDDNYRCIGLLDRLGFHFEKALLLENDQAAMKLFSVYL